MERAEKEGAEDMIVVVVLMVLMTAAVNSFSGYSN